MIFTSRNYAIGRAHFQIAGGTRLMLILTIAYFAIALSVFGLFFYNLDWPIPARVLAPIYTLVLVIEALLLVAVGSIRLSGCIRLDTMSNMIESHRLMPVEAWRAILGYWFGTTTHVLGITALNFITLAILANVALIPFNEFIVNQVVLVMFALFVWSLAAMGSLMLRQMTPLIVLGCVFGSFASIILRNIAILPGVSVLASPFLGETIFSISRGMVNFREAYPVALAAQVLLAGLFFIGACRRYRGTYLTTFNFPMGLALVAIWGLLSLVSIVNWSVWSERLFRNSNGPPREVQVLAATILAALLAMIPIYSLAAWQRRHRVNPSLTVLALLATTLLTGLNLFAATYNGSLWAVTMTVLGLHVLVVYVALRTFERMSPTSVIISMAFLGFCLWVLPILAELVRWMFLEPNVHHEIGVLGTLSPLGLLISQWTGAEPPTAWVGLLFQAAFVVSLLLLWRRMSRRPIAKSAALQPAALQPAVVTSTSPPGALT